jgi:hypothetical protein
LTSHIFRNNKNNNKKKRSKNNKSPKQSLGDLITHSDRSPLEEQFCVFKIFKMSAIFKMATKTRHKKWVVKIQHCPMSSKLGHHNLPTYQMSLKSDNVEFVRYIGGHFENGDR